LANRNEGKGERDEGEIERRVDKNRILTSFKKICCGTSPSSMWQVPELMAQFVTAVPSLWGRLGSYQGARGVTVSWLEDVESLPTQQQGV
jgi:hypothetical protein